ncbi:MAG: Gfo/Idh/MocA family oxidoreductase [Candidatus Latescibacteria bacterium]|jgi:predicted dehydrogenase|nr:Gfo/Idh/MocA family oxidoreductase [Candidatus Latescibacterota bacterium]
MGRAVRVAVVGLGQRGLQHLKALWRLQGEGATEVVALGDAFGDNLAEAKVAGFVPGFSLAGIGSFAEFDRLLSEAQPDAVYFCMPPGVHNGELIAAARAGVHLFAEKPQSLYMDEALEMDRAIRDAGVVSAVGFQRRFEAHSEAAHGFLAGKRMVMVTCVTNGTLESHSVKHTPTGELGGPVDRVWAKNAAWSGTTVVEAGIHQTDLMRYWCGDIAWVQAAYVPRDADDVVDGGDNPYAYTVTYGFRNGGVGNLLISRLRKVYHSDGYQIILWDHGHLKFERDGVVAYTYDGPYPPESRPDAEQVRHPVPAPPGRDVTEAINRTFVEAVARGDDGDIRSTFAGSMNSLAAVLAANVSHERGGERIDLEAFASSPAYAEYRRKPGGDG